MWVKELVQNHATNCMITIQVVCIVLQLYYNCLYYNCMITITIQVVCSQISDPIKWGKAKLSTWLQKENWKWIDCVK